MIRAVIARPFSLYWVRWIIALTVVNAATKSISKLLVKGCSDQNRGKNISRYNVKNE